MTRFRLKLTFTILILISFVLLLLGGFFAKVLERSYMETLSDLLRKEALLIAEAVHDPSIYNNNEKLRERVYDFTQSTEARVTVINAKGEVLSDTNHDPSDMENHSNRPEFISAMKGETAMAMRFSDTLGYQMMYISTPIKQNGMVVGVVRSAMSMESITDTIHSMWYSLLTGLLVTVLIGSLISARIASSITKPIEEITRVARNITQRQYESRVRLKASDEIGQLASAINFMASSLEQQMYEISENQQRLSGVLTNMTSGVIFVTESRRIMLVNPAVEKLLGTAGQDLVGKLHIEAGKNFVLSQSIDKCIDTGEKMREEIHIYYPEERILDVNLAPYINFKGEKKGVVTVLHDITEIRRLEKMRSEFVANVSHELRTPITSIKGFTETLLDGAMQDEELCRNFLQIISEESERLFRLIREILDLSKIEQKRIVINMTEVNINKLVEGTASLLQEQIQRKGLRFIMPAAKDVTMISDRDCMNQILLNLITNAVAYTPEGGTVKVEVSKDEQNVTIVVADTGIGIPEGDIPRIFERFYRVDKARSRDSGGTGLGLAIVKHLIDALHGEIAVQSEEGRGTTFILVFPLDK
ncbi:HAMP domain-containing protein [Brevibacillus fluminis]|uniref:histidine kinase n=1 Tax=Brevibacillus fluminis TaxID=511487 RepID=A0A3M8DN70_9BACL|nr:ATP-binding protein [Brevibacillus fluminis]RNB89542.1 HAMP domain-containing protein [Brevibacillus fluminis]